MSWNYRVIKSGEAYRVAEVYYRDGEIEAWSLEDFNPVNNWKNFQI